MARHLELELDDSTRATPVPRAAAAAPVPRGGSRAATGTARGLAQLREAGVTDPTTLQLLQMIAATSQVEQRHQPRRSEPEHAAEISALRADNRTLREHRDTLAAALGACPQCWGQRSECDGCAGDGVPGAFEPDLQLFDRFVRPAIDRMRQHTTHARQPRPAEPRDRDDRSGGTS